MLATMLETSIVTRGLRSGADYEAMAAILLASRELDGYDAVRSAGQLEVGLRSLPRFEPAEDIRIATVDGRVVGFAYGMVDGDHPEAGRILFTSGAVLPSWRGVGIGRRLFVAAAFEMEQGEGRAVTIGKLGEFLVEHRYRAFGRRQA